MYLLLFCLFFSSSVFGMATRPSVLEFRERIIEIPKDIKYRYNRLENNYIIKYKQAYHRFEFCITVLNTTIRPIFNFEYSGTGWLTIRSSTIKIQNQDGQHVDYTVVWETRNTFINNNLMYERYSVSDNELLKFLLSYVQNDSKISIQFHGKSFSETTQLYKKDVQRLNSMISVYKQLNP
ncbi:MAG: hypothetical protein ACRC0X_03550 [Brevinema sp.]